MSDARLTAQIMLCELDMQVGDSERLAILGAFGRTVDPLAGLLSNAEIRTADPPHAGIAITHLLARSVSDLLAGGHLAAHCYVQQAYGALRPVIDSCDLIALFAASPGEAERWSTTNKAHVDFSPATVREKLNRERHDPIHGFFSESGTHPRFAGMNLSGGMLADRNDAALQEARFVMGGMWSEHPSTLTVWPFAFHLAVQATAHAYALTPFMLNDHAERLSSQALADCVQFAKEGFRLVGAKLGEPADTAVYDELEALARDRTRASD